MRSANPPIPPAPALAPVAPPGALLSLGVGFGDVDVVVELPEIRASEFASPDLRLALEGSNSSPARYVQLVEVSG